jgi:SAM-dependent methyltransferase
MNRREHWESVYATRGLHDVSWFEAVPVTSLRMIEDVGISPATCVLDVGGGDSRLADELLRRGLSCLTILDISAAALARARVRLGDAAAAVHWIHADVAGPWSPPTVDVWHDRAVFHFLTDAAARRAYVAHLNAAVRPGGAAIIATFAPDGPETCSGLPVARYSPASLSAELGDAFALVEARPHTHETPWRSVQSFQYSRFRRRA